MSRAAMAVMSHYRLGVEGGQDCGEVSENWFAFPWDADEKWIIGAGCEAFVGSKEHAVELYEASSKKSCLGAYWFYKADPEKHSMYLDMSAEMGYPPAMYAIAMKYLGSDDTSVAIELLSKAADAGHPESLLYMAEAYRTGNGVPKAVLKARNLCARAYTRGLDTARDRFIETFGAEPDIDEEEGLRLCALAQMGDLRSRRICLLSRIEGITGYQALMWTIDFAESGDPLFQYKLASDFRSGIICADPDDLESCSESDKMILDWAKTNGYSVDEDLSDHVVKSLDESKKWYSIAAENGFEPAMFDLASLYVDEGDDYEAIRLYRLLSKRGNSSAQCELATLLMELGDDENNEEALEWYIYSALQGNSEAIEMLSEFDHVKGVDMLVEFLEDPEENYAEALCLVGLMFYDGSGVKKSEAKALEFLEKASAQGSSYAEEVLESMSSSQDDEYEGDEEIEFEAEVEPDVGSESENKRRYDESPEGKVLSSLEKLESGDVTALETIPNAYNSGVGLPDSDVDMLRIHRVMAMSGNARAQYLLAKALRDGVGTEKSIADAIKWMEIAAQSGYAMPSMSLP